MTRKGTKMTRMYVIGKLMLVRHDTTSLSPLNITHELRETIVSWGRWEFFMPRIEKASLKA